MNAFGQFQTFLFTTLYSALNYTLGGYLRKSLGNVSLVVRENVTLRSVHKTATRIRDSAIHSASGRIFRIQTCLKLRTRDKPSLLDKYSAML